MKITFFNTLTKKKEAFTPLRKGHARVYSCGPTVYGPQHVGNLRSAVIWDILRRVLEYNGFTVTQVLNITDFGHLTSDADEGEDKMVKGLRHEGLPMTLEAMAELGRKYTDIYVADREKLNLLSPSKLPFASEHIPEQITLIKKLEEKGYTYQTTTGVYFDTSKDPHYGKLGHLTENTEARIEQDSEKKNQRDFVLWKLNPELGWESPWGKGFPGWHIECSAMSMKYLGESFDIHTGGIEHIPIHHNNEIAQSENATGKPFATYWLHNEHLLMSGEKIAKSVGNTAYLSDIIEKGYSPFALRLLFLQAHYKTEQSFTWEALDAAQKAFDRLVSNFKSLKVGFLGRLFAKPDQEYFQKFLSAVNDDLDMPKALAIMWEVVKDTTLSPAVKRATLLDFDQVLGLDLSKIPRTPLEIEIPDEVRELVAARAEARAAKDWQKSDELRDKIRSLGYEIKDTPKGQQLDL